MTRAAHDPIGDLVLVLRQAAEPLTIRELAIELCLRDRALAYLLAGARRCGAVVMLDDGRYAAAPGRQRSTRRALAELLDQVRACEAEWRLDDRLDFQARSGKIRT